MSEPQSESKSRRDFLATSARTLAFGALGTYVIAQQTKRDRLANDPNCVKIHTCLQCIEFGGCELPKAGHARETFPDGV